MNIKPDVLNLIEQVETEEDMMKFNKFDFQNTHKVEFVLFSSSKTCQTKISKYSTPLKAFRAWTKKKIQCNSLPFIMAQTQTKYQLSFTFSVEQLLVHSPFGKVLAYQEFLYSLSDDIAYCEEMHPERL